MQILLLWMKIKIYFAFLKKSPHLFNDPRMYKYINSKQSDRENLIYLKYKLLLRHCQGYVET